jgi:hypothetical protein
MHNQLAHNWNVQFHQQHGDAVLLNGMWYFEDGARRQNEAIGRAWDPPDDDYERLKLIVTYHEEKVRLATEFFEEEKAQCLAHAKNGVGYRQMYDQADVVTYLGKLRYQVRKWRKKLEEAEAALDPVTPSWTRPVARDHSQVTRAIASINI